MHALDERLDRIARMHRHSVLDHRGSRIELFRDEVYGRAVLPITCLERAAMRIEPAVPRQQGRVDVEHPALEPAHEARPQDAHEDRKSTRLNSSHVKISYAVF